MHRKRLGGTADGSVIRRRDKSRRHAAARMVAERRGDATDRTGRLIVLNEFVWSAWKDTPGDLLSVYVDGARVGSVGSGSYMEPYEAFERCRVVANLAPGHHTVRANLLWFSSYSVPVEIESDSVTWMGANLVPLRSPGGLRRRVFLPRRAVGLVFRDPPR